MDIGENIRKFRKLNRLTQAELAAKSNISRSYLGDLEINRYNPSIDTLRAIAYVLNVNIADLIDEPSEHKQLKEILKNLHALFYNEEIPETDKDKFMAHINCVFWEARYTNKTKSK